MVFDDSNIRRQNYSNIRTIRIVKNQEFVLIFTEKIFDNKIFFVDNALRKLKFSIFYKTFEVFTSFNEIIKNFKIKKLFLLKSFINFTSQN